MMSAMFLYQSLIIETITMLLSVAKWPESKLTVTSGVFLGFCYLDVNDDNILAGMRIVLSKLDKEKIWLNPSFNMAESIFQYSFEE